MPDDVRVLIERLEALRAKATPGEWEAIDSTVIVAGSGASIGYPPVDGTIASLDDGEYIENRLAEVDAALIAEAVNALPALIAALRERTPRPGWRLVPIEPTREMVEAG